MSKSEKNSQDLFRKLKFGQPKNVQKRFSENSLGKNMQKTECYHYALNSKKIILKL